MKNRKYRFFYHWNKQQKCFSVHFKGKCHLVNTVVCDVPCYSKRNKRQPLAVMQGFANSIDIDRGETAHIIR